MALCSVTGCDAITVARGYCKKHYLRWHKHGDPEILLIVKTPIGIARKWLEEHILFSDENCLSWPFYRHSKDGRGITWRDGKHAFASRVMCEMVNGPPPTQKHQAAHSCGKAHEACINPKHLSWKTPKENAADKLLHGTKNEGERHGMSKITEIDIPLIRAATGTLYEIGDQFGISYSMACKIRRRKNWKHVK